MVGQNVSVGSGGTPNLNMLDETQRRDLLLKNAKSLGNSLGTNKKTLNMSQGGNMNLGLVGIDREHSTLNDGQFFTLAKTGLLNNLNLSQLIRTQNILEEDGIEDLHFYFVSFNNHKTKLLYNQEVKLKKLREQQKQRSHSQANHPKAQPPSSKLAKSKDPSKSLGKHNNNQLAEADEKQIVKSIESLHDEDCNFWND